MIRTYLLIAVALAFAGLTTWGFMQRATNARLSAQVTQLQTAVASAEAERDRAAQARDIARAHYLRMAKEAEDWAGLTRDLQTMEGRDAPLSDHLRSAAGRLWP